MLNSKRHNTVLGIDEAGRGPILGPMVLAAVFIEDQAIPSFEQQGIADSKHFGSTMAAKKKRKIMAEFIQTHARFAEVVVVDVSTIDRHVVRGELNVLERNVAQSLIEKAPKATTIIADGLSVFGPLSKQFPSLHAQNHAESAHIAVAAASVLAKDKRDDLFALIAKRYHKQFGEIKGGGYINKPTIAFLKQYKKTYGCFPPELRTSWNTRSLQDITIDA